MEKRELKQMLDMSEDMGASQAREDILKSLNTLIKNEKTIEGKMNNVTAFLHRLRKQCKEDKDRLIRVTIKLVEQTLGGK